jgi:hypothetical protein
MLLRLSRVFCQRGHGIVVTKQPVLSETSAVTYSSVDVPRCHAVFLACGFVAMPQIMND